jgi:hypothetical protein
MKKVEISFDRILFATNSLVDYWWYSDSHLQMVVRFIGVQVGTGADISQMDIPEAVLVFRNVVSCRKTFAPVFYGNTPGDESSESDPVSTQATGFLNDYSFYAQCTEPSGNVGWEIKAESFELLLRDDDVKKLEDTEQPRSKW